MDKRWRTRKGLTDKKILAGQSWRSIDTREKESDCSERNLRHAKTALSQRVMIDCSRARDALFFFSFIPGNFNNVLPI